MFRDLISSESFLWDLIPAFTEKSIIIERWAATGAKKLPARISGHLRREVVRGDLCHLLSYLHIIKVDLPTSRTRVHFIRTISEAPARFSFSLWFLKSSKILRAVYYGCQLSGEDATSAKSLSWKLKWPNCGRPLKAFFFLMWGISMDLPLLPPLLLQGM